MRLSSRHHISMSITDKSTSLRRLVYIFRVQHGGERSSTQFALEEVDELKAIGLDVKVRWILLLHASWLDKSLLVPSSLAA